MNRFITSRAKLTGVIGFLAICLMACVPPTSSLSDIEKRDAKFLAAYCSVDVHVAEKGLLDYVKEFEGLQQRGVVGWDYDHVFKVAHARLAVLYKQTGRTNEALRHFQIGVSHRNTAKVRREGHAFTGSMEEIETVILKLDTPLDVKWRKHLKKDSNGLP
ncbi:MAG: hypothetical protein ABMA26_02915 [Limisphaerales bacterium]